MVKGGRKQGAPEVRKAHTAVCEQARPSHAPVERPTRHAFDVESIFLRGPCVVYDLGPACACRNVTGVDRQAP